MKIAHFGIFSQYGGSGGAETILTSKCSGSTSSVSNMVDFGPPGAEKLIFSDKTSASLNDSSPKLNRTLEKCHIFKVGNGESSTTMMQMAGVAILPFSK